MPQGVAKNKKQLNKPNIVNQPLVCSVMSGSLQPHDCSAPGPSVHGILQARTLEWAAIPFSRGSSPPMDRTRVSCIAGQFSTV